MKSIINISMILAALFTCQSALSDDKVRLIVTKKTTSSALSTKSRTRSNDKLPATTSYLVKVSESEVKQKMTRLQADPNIIAVERDIPVYQINGSKSSSSSYPLIVRQNSASVEDEPNDPGFRYQSYFLPYAADNLAGSDILGAWALGPQIMRPKIAVMDGGFLEEGRFIDVDPVYNYSFIDREGSQYGDPAWNDESELECEDGHGVAVYGVVGATANNDAGIAGIIEADMYMLQVMRCGQGFMFDSARALRWAAGDTVSGLSTLDGPVDIATFSLGSISSCPTFMQSAIDFAVSRGVKVFMGAGNDDAEAAKFSPANCSGNIVTGALDRDTGDKADISNYGNEIDVMAQGTDIGSLSTFESGIGVWSGTSFAGPITAGIYGLAKSHAPSLDNSTLDKLMALTTDSLEDMPICVSNGCGAGKINAKKFVSAASLFESGTIAKVTSTLTDTALCDVTPYLMATGVKTRLCESFKVIIADELFTKSVGDLVTYRLYQWPKGRAVDSIGDTVLYEGMETEYLISGIDLDMQAGLVRCLNGRCDTSLVMPVTLDKIELPEACE